MIFSLSYDAGNNKEIQKPLLKEVRGLFGKKKWSKAKKKGINLLFN